MANITSVETQSLQVGESLSPPIASAEFWPSLDPQGGVSIQNWGVSNFNGIHNGFGICNQFGLSNLLGFGVDTGGHTDAQPYLESSADFINLNATFGFLGGFWFYKGSEISNEPDSTSDINLKKDVQPTENCLDKILNLQSYSFNWKEDIVPQLAANSHGEIGLMAQHVEGIIPEAVGTIKLVDSEQHVFEAKSINYSTITAVLIEAVKEQQEQINSLQQTVQELSTKLAECCP
jgi:hypothetical protein